MLLEPVIHMKKEEAKGQGRGLMFGKSSQEDDHPG